MEEPYIGEIKMFAGNFAPVDWLLCDGRLLGISEYEALYSVLGTTYGGDGVNTFALPDLRGRAPLHRSSSHPIGQLGGTETVALSQEQMPGHTHVPNAMSGNGSLAAPAAHYWAGNAEVLCYAQTGNPNAQFAASAIGAAGGSTPHDNMMPFTTVSFIIATNGIYPPQN